VAQIHRSFLGALQHASTWGALSALFAGGASELWAPLQHVAVAAGLICGVIGILLRSPDQDRDDVRDQSQP
jgi:ABC-type Mn2+/Zn2+ transport system permease subunit